MCVCAPDERVHGPRHAPPPLFVSPPSGSPPLLYLVARVEVILRARHSRFQRGLVRGEGEERTNDDRKEK